MKNVLTAVRINSKCSFLDDEDICKHEEYDGKRIKRGLIFNNFH